MAKIQWKCLNLCIITSQQQKWNANENHASYCKIFRIIFSNVVYFRVGL